MPSPPAPATGGCLCGKVRYALQAFSTDVGDCHCRDCQKQSGAPYVTWMTIDRRLFILRKGKLKSVRHAQRVRCFAPCCGTPLLFQDSPRAPRVDVPVATLDNPPPVHPLGAIWCEDHLPWVPMNPRIPAHVRNPDSPRWRAK